MSGPLAGVKIVEIVGLGPVPFGSMLLADMGAEVIRIDRPGGSETMKMVKPQFDAMARGRRSAIVDLKKEGAAEVVLDLIGKADAILEGFRPGVMERLGLGPDVCLKCNPKLVYGRMTGYGQDGPMSQAVGHDINYIALSGVLHTVGFPDRPPVPALNLLGDMGGGGMLLALGVVSAILEASRSGKGQVVDVAMLEGSAIMATMMWGFHGAGIWHNERGTNFGDGGAFYNRAYECADGKFISIASVEPQFYANLRKVAGLEDKYWDERTDRARWPEQTGRLAKIFKSRTRDEWCALMEGKEVCFAPVLEWSEAVHHPHNVARKSFIEVGGVTQPAPAPRFSRTPTGQPAAPSVPGAETEAILRDWGFTEVRIRTLRDAAVIASV